MGKNLRITLMAIHPPVILLVITAIVLFYCGTQFPQTMKYFLLLLISIVTVITFVMLKGKKRRYVLLSLLLGCIALLFVHERIVQILSVVLGVFISYVLIKDSQNRYKEFENIYKKISGLRNHRDLKKVLVNQRRAWCTREAAKAAFFKRSLQSYFYAKSYYLRKGYKFYHIFPDGGVRVWLSPSFWKRVGII